MKTYNDFNEMFNSQSGLKSDLFVFNRRGCVAAEVQIPGWALDYIINHVPDEITDEGKRLVDVWLNSFEYPFEKIEFCDPNDEKGHFSSHPEFGSPCRVYDCNVFCDVPKDYPYLCCPKVVEFDYDADYDD